VTLFQNLALRNQEERDSQISPKSPTNMDLKQSSDAEMTFSRGDSLNAGGWSWGDLGV
jgi:hypothetical protein